MKDYRAGVRGRLMGRMEYVSSRYYVVDMGALVGIREERYRMWTKEYRGYYIHGYLDREECCYKSDNGTMIRCKSLRAAKQAISLRINRK